MDKKIPIEILNPPNGWNLCTDIQLLSAAEGKRLRPFLYVDAIKPRLEKLLTQLADNPEAQATITESLEMFSILFDLWPTAKK